MDQVIVIRTSMAPGDIGAVVTLHGKLYAAEYHLDHTFEGYVAEGLGKFAQDYEQKKDYFAVAENDGAITGSIAIVDDSNGVARLRWFLVAPSARGAGLGRQLLNGALQFCRDSGFTSVSLWTISDLTTAARIYKQAGFRLVEEKTHFLWGAVRTEQRYELTLAPNMTSTIKQR